MNVSKLKQNLISFKMDRNSTLSWNLRASDTEEGEEEAWREKVVIVKIRKPN